MLTKKELERKKKCEDQGKEYNEKTGRCIKSKKKKQRLVLKEVEEEKTQAEPIEVVEEKQKTKKKKIKLVFKQPEEKFDEEKPELEVEREERKELPLVLKTYDQIEDEYDEIYVDYVFERLVQEDIIPKPYWNKPDLNTIELDSDKFNEMLNENLNELEDRYNY